MSDRQYSEIPIYKGDDLARLAELHQAKVVAERRYAQAQDSGTGRMGDAESPKAASDAYAAAVEEAAERATFVRIEPLGRKQWRALLDEHPPRRVQRLIDGATSEVVHEDDAELGVNTATLPEALLTYVDPNRADMRTIAKPEFPTKAALVEWLDELSGGIFDKLFLVAFFLNSSGGSDPKAEAY